MPCGYRAAPGAADSPMPGSGDRSTRAAPTLFLLLRVGHAPSWSTFPGGSYRPFLAGAFFPLAGFFFAGFFGGSDWA